MNKTVKVVLIVISCIVALGMITIVVNVLSTVNTAKKITAGSNEILQENTGNLDSINSSLQSAMIEEYDNKEMNGRLVLTTIKQYFTDPSVIIAVNINGQDIWTTSNMALNSKLESVSDGKRLKVVGIIKNSDQKSLEVYTSTDLNFRIVNTRQYVSKLIEKDGQVVGIYFQNNNK